MSANINERYVMSNLSDKEIHDLFLSVVVTFHPDYGMTYAFRTAALITAKREGCRAAALKFNIHPFTISRWRRRIRETTDKHREVINKHREVIDKHETLHRIHGNQSHQRPPSATH